MSTKKMEIRVERINRDAPKADKLRTKTVGLSVGALGGQEPRGKWSVG